MRVALRSEMVAAAVSAMMSSGVAAVLKHIIGKKAENREGRLKNAERIGTLFSAGLIVGESLVGVVMAFIIVFSVTNGGSDAPLALGLENWETTASWLGLAFFITSMVFFAQRDLCKIPQNPLNSHQDI